MHIEPFGVEQWMNAHETSARWNIAETCVAPLRLEELLALADDPGAVLTEMRSTRLGYGSIPGSVRLRAAIAALYGPDITPDHVLVANGAIGANLLVYLALVEPGDTVICVKPTYQQLYSVPAALGANVKALPLREGAGYLPDIDELIALLDDRTRLIIINNPNNPTGALMGERLLEQIVDVARGCGAWLHSDEVYRGLEHEPGTTVSSVVDLYERGISTGSMSKAYSLAGLRTGWVVGPADLITRCLAVRDYTTISCGALDDVLATLALENLDRLLTRNLEIVRGNARILGEWVGGEPALHYVPPRAGTTALIRYDLDLPSTEWCQRLFDYNGTFVVPGDAFEQGRSFRLGYACARPHLEGGLAALSDFLRGSWGRS